MDGPTVALIITLVIVTIGLMITFFTGGHQAP